ncbi:Coiled-coil domain-containing protein 11-like [Oopsacas minuta]|uniref:Cilia- and flagella-associated protein 53 n=1 Tax=Oopsacas minuta TaxID=111878 RepID=A0AAV7K6L7_9METZ|nr:Coiled-coil domain-containing protein 11-like [Oopsacas minuta]
MSMQLDRNRKVREVNGPTPHSVGIFARPPYRLPPEHLILERRRQEGLRDQALAQVTSQQEYDIKTTWEQQTDKRIQTNRVKRVVGELQRQQEHTLEERKEELRGLLWKEEEQWFREMEQQQETVEDRQQAMIEKLKMYKTKREEERKELVASKLDQQFRNNCEEVRSIMTKRHVDRVFRDREAQLKLKEQQREIEREEGRMYAELWQNDIASKAEREENETRMLIERNMETLSILDLQTAALERQKEEAQKLREEEAEFLREQSHLRAVEETRNKEEKRNRQREIRNTLDYSLKLKLKRQAKEIQEELALDMKILEDLLTSTKNEAQESLARKRERMQEMQYYRQHLREQKKVEEMRDRELDSLINDEVEKQWNKRVENWRMEKQARDKLMKDVLEDRRKQLEEKLERNRLEQEDTLMEQKRIMCNLQEHRSLEEQQKEAIRNTNKKYRQDLLYQMDYQDRMKEDEKQLELMEFMRGKEVEESYKDRVQNVLASGIDGRAHPRRSKLSYN